MLTVRPAVAADVYSLAPRLRAADVAEVKAHGYSPSMALSQGLWGSVQALTAVDCSGTPVCMFGVTELVPIAGGVWLLGTDLVKENRMSFLRLSRKWTQEFHKRFPLLTNIVDERNTVHIEWLRWLGYVFLRRLPIGVEQRPFIEFVRLQNVPTRSDGGGVLRD